MTLQQAAEVTLPSTPTPSPQTQASPPESANGESQEEPLLLRLLQEQETEWTGGCWEPNLSHSSCIWP